MEQEIRKLLERFYEGETTLSEEQYLRQYFSRADVPEELAGEKEYFLLISKEKETEASPHIALDVLQNLERPLKRPGNIVLSRAMQAAASVALLILGYWLGYSNSNRYPLQQPGAAGPAGVQQLLSLDHQNSSSASDRILVLNRMAGDPDPGESAVQMLINTLHFDPNVNVRMAALNALRPLASRPAVADAFIQSLSVQEDPLLQVSLIETLADLREKRAAALLRKISEDPHNLAPVRLKAEEAVSVIQANEWLKSI